MYLKSEEKRRVSVTLIIITIAIILYHILNNLDGFWNAASSIYRSVFSQIVSAFFIAYLLNLPMRLIEKKLKKNTGLKFGAIRAISMVLTIVLFLFLQLILLRFAIPQLAASINRLTKNLDTYIFSGKEWITRLSQNFDYTLPQAVVTKITEIFNTLVSFLSNSIGKLFEIIYGWITGTVSSLFDFLLSFVLSLYMLIEKEKIQLVLKKLLYSVTSIERGNRFLWFLKILNRSFTNFFRGQIIEGFILSVIAISTMMILGFEFSILIGAIVGITNIIPIFGPFIGGAIGFVILLMANPVQALWFAFFILILQQIESNLIYPKVVGGAIGLSGFWIFIAVIVGGGIAGLPGIILGIPLFTTMQEVLKVYMAKKLKEKEAKLPEDLKANIITNKEELKL